MELLHRREAGRVHRVPAEQMVCALGSDHGPGPSLYRPFSGLRMLQVWHSRFSKYRSRSPS